MSSVLIRSMTPADATAVLAIYQAGMDGGHASFEHTAPAWAAFEAGKLADHRLVAVDEPGRRARLVAVSRVSPNVAYAGVVEHSVDVDPCARMRGVGRALLDALIAATEAGGIWTLQSRGVPGEHGQPRPAQRVPGFVSSAMRERVGRHLAQGNRWRDVIFIERRSPHFNDGVASHHGNGRYSRGEEPASARLRPM
jgi:phosphinothricin acetyltransferase